MVDERSAADILGELQRLRDDGFITDEEFAERRTAVLDQLSAPSPGPLTPPVSKSGRWTPEEQAAYRTANPKKLMSVPAKVGIVIAIGIVVLFLLPGSIGEEFFQDSVDTNQSGESTQLTVNYPFSGTGEKNTTSFKLSGNYTVTMTSTADCYYSFSLDRTSDGRTQDNLGSHDGADTGSTQIYAVPSGTYYIDVITGPSPSCPWSVTIRN